MLDLSALSRLSSLQAVQAPPDYHQSGQSSNVWPQVPMSCLSSYVCRAKSRR